MIYLKSIYTFVALIVGRQIFSAYGLIPQIRQNYHLNFVIKETQQSWFGAQVLQQDDVVGEVRDPVFGEAVDVEEVGYLAGHDRADAGASHVGAALLRPQGDRRHTLEPGRAAVFTDGMDYPLLVAMPGSQLADRGVDGLGDRQPH